MGVTMHSHFVETMCTYTAFLAKVGLWIFVKSTTFPEHPVPGC